MFDYKVKSTEFLECIKKLKKNVSVFIHKNADGDCVGAGLALSLWLQNRDFNVKVISTNKISDSFSWMPNRQNMMIYDSLFKKGITDYVEKSDAIFCLDFSQKCRIDDDLVKIIDTKNNEQIFVIDHHLEKSEFNGFNCVNSVATSTCEVLFDMFSSIDKKEITDDIAKCLYVGIITDTGKFMTSNMTYHVHEITACLLKNHNIDVAGIQNKIYCNNKLSRLRFLGYVLNRCLHTIPNYKVSYITISKEDSAKFFLKPGDTDGIVNYGLSLSEVILTALFNEKKDGVYISFRSFGDLAVNEFAKEYFNGGGHKNAAGGFSKKSLKENIKSFVNVVKNFNYLKYDK